MLFFSTDFEDAELGLIAPKRNRVIQIDIKKNALLGKGRFGSVFEYTFDEKKVAVKRIQIHDLDETAQEEMMNREENAMRNLQHHPNVLELIAEQHDTQFK